MTFKNKPFGGEAPLHLKPMHKAMVHSGRAALGLLLLNGLKAKKFLIPDFLCPAITDVLHHHKVKFTSYAIKSDLTPDWKYIKAQSFDVLYVINYFGQKTNVPKDILKDRTLIIDDVFSPLLDIPQGNASWAVFNSLRKTTLLAEGAMVAASFPLELKHIKMTPSVFADLKYQAKAFKADYLTNGKGSQAKYLRLFERGEEKLNSFDIHTLSKTTQALLPHVLRGIECEQRLRRQQYQRLDRVLKSHALSLSPRYFSFYVLKIQRRNELKKFLAKHDVFLPVHWPALNKNGNDMYEQILSIPLDGRYSLDEIDRVAKLIRRFLDGK